MASQPSPARPRVPTPRLPPLPENEIVRVAREVVARLQEAGHEAYFVGGFIRDWLRGIEHYDVDVATSAHPDQVEALFESTHEVGKRFGVMLVTIDHMPIEVATFRHDVSYSDYRRPDEVRFGTIEEDAARRDFTINALYYDPIGGRLRDFHAGALDLRRHVLKTVGAPIKRFEEDALRLIRAVRFVAAYDLEFEARTRKALQRKAANLAKIAPERVGHELVRILTGRGAGRAVELMSELGLWAHVVPEVEAMRGVEQGADRHPEGDVFTHVARVVGALPENPSPALALAALLHDVGKPGTQSFDDDRIRFSGHQELGARMAREICGRLRFSNEIRDQVSDLVQHHMQFLHVRQMRTSTLKRFVSRPGFEDLLDLHKADALGSDGSLDAHEYCVEQRRLLALEHGGKYAPEPLATGEDLIAMGLKPGPRFKTLLDDLHDEQLEGRVKTKDEALRFLKGRAAEAPEAPPPEDGP